MNEPIAVRKRVGVPVSLLWLIGLNLVGRILWIIYMHPPQLADFDWYFTHAVQLAQGHGYFDNGKPTAYWPMGWPVILSLVIRIFGPHVMPGFFTNALLSTVIVILVYALTRRLLETGNTASSFTHRVAFTAALAYSVLPSQIEWNAVLGSEESFAVLLLASLYIYAMLIRRKDNAPWFWRTAVAGVIFGLASIIRPIGLLFPVFLAAYEFWVNRRFIVQAVLRGVTFAVAMFVGIAPVTIRNAIAMHHFILVSTNGGVNLWQGTKINGGYFWTWNPYRNPLLKVYDNEILKNQVGKKVALKYITHHPWTTLHNAMYKVFDLYKVDTNAVWYTFHVQYPHSKVLLYTFDVIDTLGYWLLMAGVLVALWVLLVRNQRNDHLLSTKFVDDNTGTPAVNIGHLRRGVGLILTFVLYNTALFFFFPAWDRFRYPLMPLFACLFGVGFIAALKWRDTRKQRSV